LMSSIKNLSRRWHYTCGLDWSLVITTLPEERTPQLAPCICLPLPAAPHFPAPPPHASPASTPIDHAPHHPSFPAPRSAVGPAVAGRGGQAPPWRREPSPASCQCLTSSLHSFQPSHQFLYRTLCRNASTHSGVELFAVFGGCESGSHKNR